MSVVIRGSAGRYFDNNYYQKDDEQALICKTGLPQHYVLRNDGTGFRMRVW